MGRTGPIASKLAPTGFSFSTRPQPSRKSLWERACSRWRPQEPHINKKGRTHQGSPFFHHAHSDHSLASHGFFVQHTTSAIPQIPVGASLLAMASARTPHQQKRANPPRLALFASHVRSQPGLPQVFRSAHDLRHPANPCGSELARDGVRKNPASTKKGEPTKVRPFCITPTQITAWPATAPQASPDPARTDECLQPVSRSPSHLRWTANGTAIR
ncbi:hypothetical protein PS900_04206 [Pseudomonas fluorescens]|uniref:Uncharacterized protein n=1 Tax=Pseudomonas fluorescens TaxID=294 RepID=A0A8H2RRE0_PSEFL|nr:hypothetical protein PS900_04206 [Pseudomonas fluorescens]